MKLIMIICAFMFVAACAEKGDEQKDKRGQKPTTPNTKNCTPTGSNNTPLQNSQSQCHMVFSLASNACAEITWLVGPNIEIENAFQVKFTNNKAAYTPTLRVGAVAVLLEDENGVQNKRFDLGVTPDANTKGQFFIDKINFTKGLWQIRVQLFDGYKLVEEHDGPHGLLYFD